MDVNQEGLKKSELKKKEKGKEKRETERQSGATDSSTDLCRVGKQRKKKMLTEKCQFPRSSDIVFDFWYLMTFVDFFLNFCFSSLSSVQF